MTPSRLGRVGARALLLLVGSGCSAFGAEVVSDAAAPASQPETVDLRPEFQKWGLDTRIQGPRGTCSVFVVTEAIEYVLTYMNDAAWVGYRALGESGSGTSAARPRRRWTHQHVQGAARQRQLRSSGGGSFP
jgi:hypothetical protein